ncbi:MAG: chemotaxis protein CheX, partial [Planctomycetes bacterium]|nr:chemotaxis protein CheX [Planctomycetota bacterium]
MTTATSTSSKTTCDINLVGPFVRSTKEVFKKMLHSDCLVGEVHPELHGHKMHSVTAMIGLSGCFCGSIALSMPVSGALEILKRMTGMESTEVDELVRDCIGEMTNMIAGKGKLELSQFAFHLGLPQVIVGSEYTVYSPRWAKHYWLPLETDF